jgi:hypothetical protein
VTSERTFDSAGREILRVNSMPDASALRIYTASYDPVGNRLTVQEFDGTRGTHEYDALYRLVTDQRDGSYSFNRTYTYDQVGNRLTKSDSGAVCTYGYDRADVHQGTEDPSEAIRPVAEKAKNDGYDIIEYWSERGPGRNYAVIDHWDVLLEKVDLTGVSR